MDRARRKHVKMAMLHITFDDFKRITDTFGPKVGDDVLKQLAERLTASIRASNAMSRDTIDRIKWFDVFRIGNADFSVLLPFVEDIGSAALVGKRVLEVMRGPLIADGTDVYLTPSIGVAGFPDDAKDTTTLIRRALGASSQALEQGGGRLQFYSAQMNKTSRRRFRLEADLRRAIDNGEFRLLYQPKVSVETGAIIGAEALVRWQRPDGAIISPVNFIPIAEESGLILPIGEWVLRVACRQIALWQTEGFNIKVSVNISARQFFETDLVALVKSTLSESAIDPIHLVLEITETLLVEHVEQAIDTIKKLRNLGLLISMDDFGTGYSSLSYLKCFPIDEVKIDRAFLIDAVTSRKDQALVVAVIYLAHQFGFRVCAEGVEEKAQLNFLKKVKCDEYQGYYFSRPISAIDFAKKLRKEI
jgi:diguanylate cyclase (GGDEF)-like protein